MKKCGAGSIGRLLAMAGRLPGRAVCLYGSDEPPTGSVQLSRVDRCVARAVYKIALDPHAPAVFFGTDAREGICGGGQTWCGLTEAGPMLKFFVSTGTPAFRGGAAEYLKPDPEAAERFFNAPGRVITPARYLNLAGNDQVLDDLDLLSYIFIGSAESIRNLSGLVHFVSEDIFDSILMPGGPSCASMITYAAGMAERAPRDRGFIGPVDPTGNAWLPPDFMSLAIPFALAKMMADKVQASFLRKRPHVAFPAERLSLYEEKEL
jgi:hypothetical protein